jgi:acetylornithine deacetylase/succinyl-diaminopimelate desuccinylase-like protein
MTEWVESQKVPGLTMEMKQLEGRTPLIFMEVEATEPDAGTVLLYGHMDKQPPFEGWTAPWAPYDPIMTKDGKLYGRGGADDGYAIFAAITALKAIKATGKKHGRAVVMIEACEESGSPDLPMYIEHFKERIGSPG